MTHFNTSHQVAPMINQLRAHSEGQDARVLAFFESNAQKNYTPSEIRLFVFEKTVPVTSVRRAMTTLTADQKLLKTKTQRDGPYGRPEYAWRIRGPGQFELEL